MLRTGSGQTEGTHSEKENAIAGAGPTEHAEEALEIVVATMAAPMPQLEVRDIHAPSFSLRLLPSGVPDIQQNTVINQDRK
jgi:hypothetical protein